MKTPLRNQLLFALALAATGCDDPDGDLTEVDDDGEVSLRPGSVGGIWFNTNWIGKVALSELSTTFGVSHDGATLNSVSLSKLGKVDKVFVKNGQVFGVIGGQTFPDKYFLNSKWALTVEMEGVDTEAAMLLTAIKIVGPNTVYTFTYTYDGGPKNPLPTCDEDPASPGIQYGAILSGDISVDATNGAIKSRPGTIYIGCLSGGVGKAAKWGYPLHSVGLPAFEAAVRMVRADYCGTGHSFTVPGNPVEIEDAWGRNHFVTPGETEALWGTKGAQCVFTPRNKLEFPTAKSVQVQCYALGATVPKECGATDDLSTFGSLFWTKNP